MLLVVIGAGASFDCHPVIPQDAAGHVVVGGVRTYMAFKRLQPPLARDLFANNPSFQPLIVDFSAIRPLARHLRQADNTDALEERLATYDAEAASHPARQRHLMAMRFYLRDILDVCSQAMLHPAVDAGNTNYVDLMRFLYEWAEDRDEHVCCVSFNYDYLLEQAAQDVWGFRYQHLDAYVSDPRFAIVKPHGSVLWERPSGLPRLHTASDGEYRVAAANALIDAANEVTSRSGSIRPWDRAAKSAEPGVPALAPPLRGKSDFEWPDDQHDHFISHRQQVSAVLTVGWRAAEPHFVALMKPLLQGLALPSLIVTGGPEAEQDGRMVAQRLGLSGPDDGTYLGHVDEGFTALLEGGHLKEWLNGR